jgi:hypothetical protein
MLAIAVLAAALLFSSAANAKGCLKGAAVGGVAGHVAGRHGLIGGAAGCAVGNHRANKKERQTASRRNSVPSRAQ